MSEPTNLQSAYPAQPAESASAARRIRLGRLSLAWTDVIFCLVLLLTCANYFTGILSVPFHPDESTQIFMSADVDLLATHPAQLLWQTAPADALRQHYRELDAPLNRYLIGIGRWVAHLGQLPDDWDWGKPWAANVTQGALPSTTLLLAARISVAWLFPVSLALIYLGCRQAGHAWAGLAAAAILGIHPLALLHTRRAMAESALLFGSALLIWVLSLRTIRPWVIGLIGALAMSAKQSALGLFPAALIVTALPGISKSVRWTSILLRLTETLVCLAFVTFILNPFLWQNPLGAASAALSARQALATQQAADYQTQYPGSSATVTTQALVVIGELFIAPLQFEEAGNYIVDTARQKQAYLANPRNNLLGGPTWGAVLFFLTCIGIAASSIKLRSAQNPDRGWLGLLMLASLGEFLVLVIALPLPFQRYVIPLLPLVCIWAGLGVETILNGFFKRKNSH